MRQESLVTVVLDLFTKFGSVPGTFGIKSCRRGPGACGNFKDNRCTVPDVSGKTCPKLPPFPGESLG